jgi:hypothetical protein
MVAEVGRRRLLNAKALHFTKLFSFTTLKRHTYRSQ